MKKVLLASLLTSTVLVGLVATSSQAYADTTATTNGNANFGVSKDRPKTIKPGTNDPITPESAIANTEENNVWLLHAPSFDFGKQTINTSQDTEYEVKTSTYKKDGNTTDNFEIPQFLQVADNSGKKGTAWSVTVYQNAEFENVAQNTKLTNTRIRFYGQTLTNNVRTATQVPDTIAGFTKEASTNYRTLPVGQANAISILSSKASTDDAKTTSGTVSSLVLKDSYAAADYGTTPLAATAAVDDRSDNDGVKLNVPYADTPQQLEYKATISWTLSATPIP